MIYKDMYKNVKIVTEREQDNFNLVHMPFVCQLILQKQTSPQIVPSVMLLRREK